jgi:adenylate cyclase
MSRVIAEHRGHVAALVGDGIFALFGALEHDPWQSDGAAHAALAMRVEIADYNAELADAGLPSLALGIGLHRGSGVAGLVGSPELMTYAFVGRAVNLAARVQDLTRVYGVDVLVTEAVRSAIDPRFALRELPPREVRGIAEPVATFALEGFDART